MASPEEFLNARSLQFTSEKQDIGSVPGTVGIGHVSNKLEEGVLERDILDLSAYKPFEDGTFNPPPRK